MSRVSRLSGVLRLKQGTHSQVRRALQISLFESTFGNIFAILVGGAYLTGYALLLGASDLHLGILGALPMIASIPGLAGAWLAERWQSRKKVALLTTALGRFMWVPLIFLPYIPTPVAWTMLLFIVLFALSSILQGVSAIVWLGWMSDLVPEKLRGRFWGQRNQYVNAGAIAAMVFAGVMLDWFRGRGLELTGYQLLFGFALVCGVISWLGLSKQHEPPLEESKIKGFWKNARIPLKDKVFAPAMWGLALFQFSVGLVGVFVSAYMLKHLNLSFTVISGGMILHLVIGIFVSPMWGYAMDHSGMKAVALVNGFLVVLVPYMWIMSLTLGVWMVWALWALSGIGWVGFGLVSLNLPFALSPRAGRSYYIAVNGIVNGLAFFIGSLIGGVVAESLADWETHIGPFKIVNYSVLFFLSGVGRFASLFIFMRIEEVKKKPLLESINYVSSLAWTRLLDIGGQGIRIVASGWRGKPPRGY